jgi:hypothetical protein
VTVNTINNIYFITTASLNLIENLVTVNIINNIYFIIKIFFCYNSREFGDSYHYSTIISKEDFEKARQRMQTSKRTPGVHKGKEVYLLSGLIFCAECGHAMAGNARHGGRNKLKYVSYRCGDRDRTKQCDNKELRREYIEGFVLAELEKCIFNGEAIPHLYMYYKKYSMIYCLVSVIL